MWHQCLLLCSLLHQAKLGDEILDYRDLAALPKSKAIYNIDRPDMISYSPYISHSAMGDRQSYGEVWIFTVCCMLPQLLALVDTVSHCHHPQLLHPQITCPSYSHSTMPPQGSESKSGLEESRVGERETHAKAVCIFLATESFHDT